MQELIQAYITASEGYSVDRVIADPKLNAIFLEECHRLGLQGPPSDLNRRLLNLRKRGLVKRSQRITRFTDLDEYAFASEIAVRFLMRRDSTTLDEIICDPGRAQEFDGIASDLAPGFQSVQYRWAALSLRKQRKLPPELVSRVASPPIDVVRYKVIDLDVQDVPQCQGLYLFHSSSEVLYVGEATNLRSRMKKHLDHSDNKGLARWLWEQGDGDLRLELHVLEEATPTLARKALERELIHSRHPIFNVQR